MRAQGSAARQVPITAEEFERMPQEEGSLVELVRGTLVRESVVLRERGPRPLHGRLQARIAYLLETWMVQRRERGAIVVHTGFVVATDPDTVRLPDVAYVSEARMPEARYGAGLWRLGPDLAVEVTSPTNTWTEMQDKVTDYLGAGTSMVWVIDPPTRTVTVYRSGAAATRLDETGTLDGEDALPGFAARLAEFFDI